MPGSNKSTIPVPPLRVTRAEACAMLRISVEKCREYEKRGWLTPLKDGESKQCHVYYAMFEVEALVERLHAEAKAAWKTKVG
jgi:hypothetical protein